MSLPLFPKGEVRVQDLKTTFSHTQTYTLPLAALNAIPQYWQGRSSSLRGTYWPCSMNFRVQWFPQLTTRMFPSLSQCHSMRMKKLALTRTTCAKWIEWLNNNGDTMLKRPFLCHLLLPHTPALMRIGMPSFSKSSISQTVDMGFPWCAGFPLQCGDFKDMNFSLCWLLMSTTSKVMQLNLQETSHWCKALLTVFS